MHQVSRIEVRRIFTPAPAPDDGHARISADTTPAGPPGAQGPNNEREHSVSVETAQENKEHDIMMPKPKPRSLYQQPLKSLSEPTLSTSNPEWELSRERLAAQLERLHAPPRSFCHPLGLNQDDLLIRSTFVEGMYDGDVALPGPSLGVGTIHMGSSVPQYSRHERRSRSRSGEPVRNRFLLATPPATPLRGVVGNSQDHRVSFEDMEPAVEHRHEDTGVASEIAEAPVLRSPHNSGTSYEVPQKATRWDQNIKKNRFTRWLWLVLPDLCFLFFAFIAAVCLDKFLANFRWMHRTIPMTWDSRTNTWVGPVEISWPKEDFILPILTAEILIPLIPTIVLLKMQIWVRNFWDFNAAVFGLFKGIAIVYVPSRPISNLIEGKRIALVRIRTTIILGFHR